MSEWTTDRIELLRKWKGEGYSGSEIASMLNSQTGAAFTRNAIIGKSDRLGLEKKVKREAVKSEITAITPVTRNQRVKTGIGAQVSAIKRMKRSSTIKIKPEPFVVRSVDISPLNIPFAELNGSVCKFECTDAAHPSEFLFCGHPSVAGKPYCEAHNRIARGIGTASERAVAPFSRREAA